MYFCDQKQSCAYREWEGFQIVITSVLLNLMLSMLSLQSMPSQAFLYENTHNTVTIEELQKLAPGVKEIFSCLALSLLADPY